jgi:hypothetical protein
LWDELTVVGRMILVMGLLRCGENEEEWMIPDMEGCGWMDDICGRCNI